MRNCEHAYNGITIRSAKVIKKSTIAKVCIFFEQRIGFLYTFAGQTALYFFRMNSIHIDTVQENNYSAANCLQVAVCQCVMMGGVKTLNTTNYNHFGRRNYFRNGLFYCPARTIGWGDFTI